MVTVTKLSFAVTYLLLMADLVHVGIIMDGNGRWAKNKGLPRVEGHKSGLDTVESIIDCSINLGIKYLSLYVFSTENWKRPRTEVDALFSLALKYLDRLETFCQKGIKIVVSGERDGIPVKLCKKIDYIQQATASNDVICVNLCINYGGQKEIVYAVKQLVDNNLEITEQAICDHLYNNLPQPDLIIRTGGQKRLSNFLLFGSAYAELFFSDTLWPDFSCEEYCEIVSQYHKRVRNFGGI